jgi:hypothetical protein
MQTAGGFSALLRGFRLALTVEGLRPHTIHTYLRDVERFALAGARASKGGRYSHPHRYRKPHDGVDQPQGGCLRPMGQVQDLFTNGLNSRMSRTFTELSPLKS